MVLECLVQVEDLGGIGDCFVEPNLRRREPKRADQGPALARSSGPRLAHGRSCLKCV